MCVLQQVRHVEDHKTATTICVFLNCNHDRSKILTFAKPNLNLISFGDCSPKKNDSISCEVPQIGADYVYVQVKSPLATAVIMMVAKEEVRLHHYPEQKVSTMDIWIGFEFGGCKLTM